MIERPYVTDGKDNGYLIMTEATLRVETPRGWRKCPAGTMFHLGVTRKTRPGLAVEGSVATETTGYHNVIIHWAKDRKDAETCENEGSLRRKIVKAENRRWWWRSLVIGVAGGVTLEALSAIPWLTDRVLGTFS